MNLYLVKTADDGIDLWVAHETNDGDLYVYVQNTGKFHRNTALEEDFYVEQELTYSPISITDAKQLIGAGRVGKLDARTKSAQVKRYENDTAARDVQSILGVKPSRSKSDIRRARVNALRNAKPGISITWNEYPLSKIHTARVAVTDIRKQRIKVLAALGELNAWVETTHDEALVKVTRVADQVGARVSAG